mmetsp:Transcript_8399/g.19776  ORF Transcript_8399/g.19776 Transcript_8399/m.19776 type:complete len:84 (+) Transcript_8399:845-1096(+)
MAVGPPSNMAQAHRNPSAVFQLRRVLEALLWVAVLAVLRMTCKAQDAICGPRVMWAPGRHVNVLSWLPNVVEVCMTVDEPAPE